MKLKILLESAGLANGILLFYSNGRNKLEKIEVSMQSEIGSALLFDNGIVLVFLIEQYFADPGVGRVASYWSDWSMGEVKGVCPQSMSGIRDKPILCMNIPRER